MSILRKLQGRGAIKGLKADSYVKQFAGSKIWAPFVTLGGWNVAKIEAKVKGHQRVDSH